MKKVYRTISGRKLDLSKITQPESKILREALERVRETGGWNRFAAWWLKAFNESGLPDSSPVFRICRDLEARLGISEGKVAPPDYRDYLADLIEEHFGSRYRFCKETGIDAGQLSRVLAGKADLSTDLLKRALNKLDAHVEIRPNREAKQTFSRDEAIESLSEFVDTLGDDEQDTDNNEGRRRRPDLFDARKWKSVETVDPDDGARAGDPPRQFSEAA